MFYSVKVSFESEKFSKVHGRNFTLERNFAVGSQSPLRCCALDHCTIQPRACVHACVRVCVCVCVLQSDWEGALKAMDHAVSDMPRTDHRLFVFHFRYLHRVAHKRH